MFIWLNIQLLAEEYESWMLAERWLNNQPFAESYKTWMNAGWIIQSKSGMHSCKKHAQLEEFIVMISLPADFCRWCSSTSPRASLRWQHIRIAFLSVGLDNTFMKMKKNDEDSAKRRGQTENTLKCQYICKKNSHQIHVWVAWHLLGERSGLDNQCQSALQQPSVRQDNKNNVIEKIAPD